MHKHIDWDDPGADSVMQYFAKHPHHHADPGPGDILSARHQGTIVRIKVEAYVDGTSIGDVVALIAADNGRRLKSHGKLELGDTVRLADTDRAMEPNHPHEDDAEEED
ncbi:hypothetical protein [Halomonas elongata]|uniref:hypothetical protein n=1 Tax=Halomonas elongata TaxID=2746 RepID=UPI0023AF94CD|nr:hypothetical protein [Halomonas elongata]